MPSETPTLAEILASAADVLFPAESGEKVITPHCHGIDNDTALHVMAWRRDVDSARVLIAAGADVNAVGDLGETPLAVAIRQSDRLMIEVLVGAGARWDIRSESGLTSRERAAGMGAEVLSWLQNPIPTTVGERET